MRKMFGKSKKEEPEEDPNRAQLFGNKNKNVSAPQTLDRPAANANPYASNSYNSQPPPNQNTYGGGGGYGGQQQNNYAQSNNYNQPNSYGGGYKEPTSYGGAPEPKSYGGAPEPKAYGMGSQYTSRATYDRQDSDSTYDSNREALFGSKQQQQQLLQKVQAQPQDTYSGGAPTGAGAYAQTDGYAQQSSYGGYAPPKRTHNPISDPYNTSVDNERQLTAEEEEDEDVDALKQQIRFTKQESLASTQNALRAAQQAEETGRNTLVRLGEQGEKLHNTEVNLSLAKNHGRIAEAKAKELKTLNRSMFAVHVANPFNSQTRAQEKEQQILRQQQIDREEKDRNRLNQFESKQRVGGTLGGMGANGKPRQKMSLAEKARFQYEADEEDDRLEDEIDDNLNQIGDVTSRLKMLAMATSKEVDEQNTRIGKLTKDSEAVDDQIALNTHRLKRFGA